MALKQPALIAPRLQRAWWITASLCSVIALGGCGAHRRESLRPTYSSPATVSAPGTNCGTGGAVIGAPAAGAGSSRALSSEPVIESPSGATESTVPPLEAPGGPAQASPRSSLPEEAPKASIGDEPSLEITPSQSGKARGAPAPTPSSSAPSSKPLLNGPGASAKSSRNTNSGVRTASADSRVRRASVQERLRPFLGDSAGSELFYPNKADRPWQYIVLHHSANPAGSYDQIDAEHRKILGYDGCGYHFVIGNGTGSDDGRIEVAQRWVNQKHGVHCRNAKSAAIDEYGIGICFVGDLDKQAPTARQVAAAKALIAYLSARYRITPDRVQTHTHVATTPTVCPGRYFPSESLLTSAPRSAGRIDRQPVPTSWRVNHRAGPASY
ncbi:MAG: peptidoglycan recognition protein family protein [Isosphaeraceae bacterium]